MTTATQSVEFDPLLMARYDVTAPRYTSYPTAPQFHGGFGEAQLCEAALASNQTNAPLSLYVHVPFCMSPCFYCGCTRVITRDVALTKTASHRADGSDRDGTSLWLQLEGCGLQLLLH